MTKLAELSHVKRRLRSLAHNELHSRLLPGGLVYAHASETEPTYPHTNPKDDYLGALYTWRHNQADHYADVYMSADGNTVLFRVEADPENLITSTPSLKDIFSDEYHTRLAVAFYYAVHANASRN